MGIQSLGQINKGDIVIPASGGDPILIGAFERDKDNAIVGYFGYPIVENDRVRSGLRAELINKSHLTQGSLSGANLSEPAVVINPNQPAYVSVSDDTYFVNYLGTAKPDFFTAINNIFRDLKSGLMQSPRIRGQDLSRLQAEKGGSRKNLVGQEPTSDPEGPKRQYRKKITSVSTRMDMYLETAVENGILPESLYAALSQDRERFVTLHDLFNEQNKPYVEELVQEQIIAQELPITDGDEQILDENNIIQASMQTPFTKAYELGWISQRTFEILTEQEDPEENMNCVTLYDAFISIGAYSDYLEEYKNPSSNRVLGPRIQEDVIADIKNAFREYSKTIPVRQLPKEIKDIRGNFFAHVTERGADVIRSPIVEVNYTPAALKEAKLQRSDLTSKRPQQLDI